ncbi:hypothetical protein CRYUN_Cryun09bG0033100 [Craigia yunnanensis]
MKDQPMPEAIKGLLLEDPASALDSEKKMKHFVKDFDSRKNLIMYHNIPECKEEEEDKELCQVGLEGSQANIIT